MALSSHVSSTLERFFFTPPPYAPGLNQNGIVHFRPTWKMLEKDVMDDFCWLSKKYKTAKDAAMKYFQAKRMHEDAFRNRVLEHVDELCMCCAPKEKDEDMPEKEKFGKNELKRAREMLSETLSENISRKNSKKNTSDVNESVVNTRENDKTAIENVDTMSINLNNQTEPKNLLNRVELESLQKIVESENEDNQDNLPGVPEVSDCFVADNQPITSETQVSNSVCECSCHKFINNVISKENSSVENFLSISRQSLEALKKSSSNELGYFLLYFKLIFVSI